MTPQEILAAFEALSPGQRRRLLRRLQAMGLLETDALTTDQDRLAAATALDEQRLAMARSALPAAENYPKTGQPSKPRSTKQPYSDADYESPVSGRVVLGAPSGEVEDNDPHAMLPLPGQAPHKPIEIIFDGGSRGNPGRGYGSYALRWPGLPEQIVKLQFGDRVTNNEAEYDTLIAALEATLKRLQDAGAAPETAHLIIWGDSLLVVNQVNGVWQSKEERLRQRMRRVQAILANFAHWQLRHHARKNSVDVLGH